MKGWNIKEWCRLLNIIDDDDGGVQKYLQTRKSGKLRVANVWAKFDTQAPGRQCVIL